MTLIHGEVLLQLSDLRANRLVRLDEVCRHADIDYYGSGRSSMALLLHSVPRVADYNVWLRGTPYDIDKHGRRSRFSVHLSRKFVCPLWGLYECYDQFPLIITGVESLPGELARNLSRLCEIDVKTQKVVAELNTLCEQSKNASSEEERRVIISKFERNLYTLRRIGDEKGVVSSNLQETVSPTITAGIQRLSGAF